MSKFSSYRCDGDHCEQIRGVANNWFIVILGAWRVEPESAAAGAASVAAATTDACAATATARPATWDPAAVAVFHFSEDLAEVADAMHLCSQACVVKRVSQWAGAAGAGAATSAVGAED